MHGELAPHVHAFDAAANTPPEWLHVLPASTFTGIDGRGPFIVSDLQAIVDASLAKGAIAVDENHVLETGFGPARAVGWIREMDVRADGIWAKVEWNRSGAGLVEDRAYRGVSPVIMGRKPRRGGPVTVTSIASVALTNDPNVAELKTLHSREKSMDLEKLRAVLGLDPDADETAILEAATAVQTAVEAHSSDLQRLADAAGLQGDATPEALVKHLQSGSNATISQLTKELAEVKATNAKDRAEAFIDKAIEGGKPIASQRDHYIARHCRDAEAVETEINALPSIHAGSIVPPADDTDETAGKLTDSDRAVMAQMNVSEEDFLASKAELAKEAV